MKPNIDVSLQTLSEQEIATLAHVIAQGVPPNTRRALKSDMEYIKTWYKLATNTELPWPANEEIIAKFQAHHLFLERERKMDPNHGMPIEIDEKLVRLGIKKKLGPHAPATVSRRLSSWSRFHISRDVENPFENKRIRKLLRTLTASSEHVPQRKSKKPIEAEMLNELRAECGENDPIDNLVGIRDRALLGYMFASGGRRRSEVKTLWYEDIEHQGVVPISPEDPEAGKMSVLKILLRKTKTTSRKDAPTVYLLGDPADDLIFWMKVSGITEGPVFRAISKDGKVRENAIGLSGETVRKIIKKRVEEAGYNVKDFSAHGLRSGYMTSAVKANVSLSEAMSASLHRSVQQASQYFIDVEKENNPAFRLLTPKK